MSSQARLARVVVYLAAAPLFGCAPSPEGAAFGATAGGSAGSPGSGGGGMTAAGGTASGGTASGGTLPVTGGAAAVGGMAQAGSAGTAGSLPGDASELMDTALPGELAAFDSAEHSLLPTELWGSLQKPYPTNAWWQNLVLNAGESPINALPYLLAASSQGLRVCHAKQVVEPNYTFSVMTDDWVLSSVEPLGARSLVAHDALSATLEWQASNGSLRTPLVQGMAYVSGRYSGLRPRLTSAHAIATVNGVSATSADGTRWVVGLNNGQTWHVYSSQPVTWQLSGQALQAAQPLNGWLRVAVSPTPELGALLDQHQSSVPLGGTVSAQAGGDVARLGFDWLTEGAGEPLMFALAHHLPTLTTPVEQASLPTIRGPMRAVAGKRWDFDEPLSQIAWSAPRPVPAERRPALLEALRADAATLAPKSEEPYFFGKELSAVARLTLIADELGEDALAVELRAKLASWLEPWLSGGVGSRLVYDASWGGLVSRPGIAEAGADFGLGYYNDHHFQYGYFIYAAAVLARKSPEWAASHREQVEVLLRDYANPRGDAFFPAYRCKDWFVGHSWAAGIFEFADSRNQESTSEAVNGYYAAYLWGLATNDPRVRDFGRLLLATELRASRTYWQISDTSIYPEPFASRKIVGVLWATKADHTTWFGSQLEFIHGIQWMPFTPISEELLPRAWIAETHPLVRAAFDRSDPVMGESWRGLVHMAHAIIDAQAAWSEVDALRSFDEGNSRTNALYWVATR